MDNLKVGANDLGRAFDIMAASGKLGSFELGAMARNFPTITASARALGVEGVQGVASLSAALQVAMKSAGSEDEAANNLTDFLGKLTAPDTLDKFADFGVDVEKELQLAIERGTDPLKHMLDVINKITGGDSFKMGELFADKQVLGFLRAAIPNLEEFRRIRDAALGSSGVIDADYERVIKGFNQSLRGLGSSVTSLLGGSGALLPIFTDLIQSTTVLVNQVNAWTQANPELTGTIVKGAAALVALSVGTTVARYGFALLGGGFLSTASLFLKFNEARRNVSIIGRALRGVSGASRLAGRGVWGLARGAAALTSAVASPLRWSRFIPRLDLARFISRLTWTRNLIPSIPCAKFVGRLALASLIVPLRWTAVLLPSFGPTLARFQGFRRDVSTELTGVKVRAQCVTQYLADDEFDAADGRSRSIGNGSGPFADPRWRGGAGRIPSTQSREHGRCIPLDAGIEPIDERLRVVRRKDGGDGVQTPVRSRPVAREQPSSITRSRHPRSKSPRHRPLVRVALARRAAAAEHSGPARRAAAGPERRVDGRYAAFGRAGGHRHRNPGGRLGRSATSTGRNAPRTPADPLVVPAGAAPPGLRRAATERRGSEQLRELADLQRRRLRQHAGQRPGGGGGCRSQGAARCSAAGRSRDSARRPARPG